MYPFIGWAVMASLLAVGSSPPPTPNDSYVYLSQDTFTVQTKVTVEYVYVVGSAGMEPGDSIRVEDPYLHGMRWSKYGNLVLNADECSALATGQDYSDGLVTAYTTGSATLGLSRVDEDGQEQPKPDLHTRTFTEITVESGDLLSGDEIVMIVGDTSTNSLCGHEMPDRAFKHVEWPASEKLGSALEYSDVGNVPTFDLLADEQVNTLLVVVPSYVVAGETFRLKVSPLDYLGNPVEQWTGTVRIDEDYGGGVHQYSPTDGGTHDFYLVVEDTGVHRIPVEAISGADGLWATSNPMIVLDEPPERNLFWGDIHSHHGHTYVDEDSERVDENHHYARDIVGLDVSSESQKAVPTEIDGEDLWQELQDNCTAYTEDGEYLALLSFEWVGDFRSSSSADKFHHNVYYDDCNGPLGEHEDTVLLEDLYSWVHQVESDYGSRAVLVPHASRFTGYDWDHQDFDLRRLVEVYSEWGNNMEPPNDPDAVPTALRKGNRLGFIGGSDNHDGWMGNPYSVLNSPSGLGAFWAPSLQRQDIWDAIKYRHTYGTTGDRIIVEFYAVEKTNIHEGEAYVADIPVFRWNCHGTSDISEISLKAVAIDENASLEDLYTETPKTLDREEGTFVWDTWDGRDYAVWLQLRQDGEDGVEYAWSSPIWVTTDCSTEEVQDPSDRCPDTGYLDTAGLPSSGADSQTPGSRGCSCHAGSQKTGSCLLSAFLALSVLSRRRQGNWSRLPMLSPFST